MASIRIRVELHRPDRGIEMSKLASLSAESQKLLKMVAEEVGLEASEGTWIAQDFYNQSVGFDAEYQFAEVEAAQVTAYNKTLHALAQLDRASNWTVPGVRPATIVQFAKVATLAEHGETVRLGLYREEDALDVEWQSLQKDRAVAIIEHYDEWIEYRGMLQGIIHSLFKESAPPYFVLRDFASRDLVKCVFRPTDYAEVYKALERKNGVVLVSGWVVAKRLDRTISEMRVEKMQATKPLDVEQMKAFFGSAPGWTADLTSDEFIDRVRERDGE